MSKKSGKQRNCPAAGREITAAECGEHRGSRYQCPAHCPHNPFAPANYSQLLDLEGILDPKCMIRLKDEAADPTAFDKALQKALHDPLLHAMHAFYEWHLFFGRDASGLTHAERWERAGFPGLKNDERVLLRAKMQTRVALMEIRCVLDNERTEAVDLLSPGSAPLLLRDRSLAAMAPRFLPCVVWIYPLPHFWRLSGTVVLIPEMAQFEPAEIVAEIVRHLGGPATEPEMRRWLAENFVRFDQALSATARARRMQMFAGMDAHFGKAIYELQAPFGDCREKLDAVAAVRPDSLSTEERNEGFAEGRVWFDDDSSADFGLPEGARPALGRVLLGQSHWRLEAIGTERLARFRTLFQTELANRVRFAGERQDNLGAKLAEKETGIDESLVPPRLLDQPQKILLASSRMSPLPNNLPREQVEAELMAAHDRAFLDDHIPALDGRTPREAARDPALRPKLIRLLKQRVRMTDERNLRTGRTDDVNWMLRELGATEILFDPPPWRPRPPELSDSDSDEDWDDGQPDTDFAQLPPPPSLPAEPLTVEQAAERLEAAMNSFETAEEAMNELEESGSTIIEDVFHLTAELLDEKAYSVAVSFLIQAWFVLVPLGCQAPPIEFEALAKAFDRERANFLRTLQMGSPEALMRYLEDSPQPGLVQMLALGVMESEKHAPKVMRPRLEDQPVIVALLKAVVELLDQALRA
jgi:hypothetical protein